MDKLLVITDGRQKGTSFPVTGEPISIGRDRRNTLTVDDDEVSRYHCEITCKNQQVFVEDLTSSNGTFVNGHMIRRSPLQRGDKIRIGQTEIKFDDSLSVSSLDAESLETSLTNDYQADTETVGLKIETGSTYYDLLADQGPDEAGRRFVQINNDLRFLYKASLATSRKVDATKMLDELMDLVFDWTGADHGYVFMKNADESEFSIRLDRQRNPSSASQGHQTYQSIVQYVCKHKVGVLSRKPMRDTRWRLPTNTESTVKNVPAEFESDSNENLKRIGEVMCVPIQGRGEMLGLIYIDVLQNPSPRVIRFNEDHLRLMLAMAHQAAVAIENETYYEALVEKERMAAVGETATLMSHRINNILQGINGGSHLVEVGLEKEDIKMSRNGWKIVSSNQAKIAELITDLLVLGKPFEPNRTQFRFDQLVAETMDGLKEFFESEKVSCQFENVSSESQNFDIVADRESSKLAIENVARVAATAVQTDNQTDDGEVKVSVSKLKSDVVLTLEYCGAEICLDAEEFTSNPSENLIIGGIEFAVSRKIIRGQNGDISIASDGDSHVVTVSLPSVPSSQG